MQTLQEALGKDVSVPHLRKNLTSLCDKFRQMTPGLRIGLSAFRPRPWRGLVIPMAVHGDSPPSELETSRHGKVESSMT